MADRGLNASAFADMLGIQRSGISHLFSGRNKPSLDLVLKIADSFPDVSIEWLLLGKESLGSEISTPDKVTNVIPEKDKEITNVIGRELPVKKSSSGQVPEQIPVQEEVQVRVKPELLPQQEPEPVSAVKSQKENADASVSASKKQFNGLIVLYEDGTFSEYTRRQES